MSAKSGVTLMEIIVVVIVVGVLSTLAMPAFEVTRERALDREARANLKLLYSAQKIYDFETGTYFLPETTTDINQINPGLKVDLPHESPWVYDITQANSFAFTIQARRLGGSQPRTWEIKDSTVTEEPYRNP
jgi:prepilin-type N-terminal cleavage/methylation domain-containing protein